MKGNKRSKTIVSLVAFATAIGGISVAAASASPVSRLSGNTIENAFQFDTSASAISGGYQVTTQKGNKVDFAASGVTMDSAVNFVDGGTIANKTNYGIKGITSISFDVNDGSSFTLKSGTNPSHLDESHVITADGEVTLTKVASFFEIAANGAGSLVSFKANYSCTDVPDTSIHSGSGIYTTRENDGVISLYNTCKCGALVGDAVKETAKKTGATLDITTSTSYPWTYDDATKTWTSGNKGKGGTSSYLWAEAKTAGNVTFDWTSSGEGGYDYLFVGKSSSESSALVTGKGSGASENNKSGTYSVDLAKGEKLYCIFKKDSSGDKGKDCGTIKFGASSFEYAALSFNTNGGSNVDPMFLINGKPESAITATSSKDGFYFEGWCVDKDLNTPYTADYTFTGDSVLYAKYSEALTIHYHKNDGTEAVTDVKFQQGTVPGSTENPTRAGYYFLGWYTHPTDFSEANKYVPAAATADVDVYARWFDETQASPFYGDYKGIKFYVSSSSWSTSTSYPDFKVDVTGNYDLRTSYSSYVYGSITNYDADTGVITTASNGSKTYGGKYMITPESGVIIATESSSNKFGNGAFYVYQKGASSYFTGCKVIGLNSNKLIAASFPVNGSTKYILVDANTGVISYDVTFASLYTGNAITDVTKLSDEFGFSVTDKNANVIKYYATSTSKTYTTVTDGYEGVYTNADNTDTLYVTGTGLWQSKKNSSSMALSTSATYTELSENVIYAKYSSTVRYNFTLDKANHKFTSVVPTVTVTLDYNYEDGGEEVTETQQWTKEVWTGITPTKSTERTGYIFDGWYDAATGGNKITGNKSLTADTTFWAHWNTAIVLTVHPNNGDANYTKSGVAGATVSGVTEPTKAGQLFAGWFTDEEFENPWDGKFGSVNSDIYAKYENAPAWSSKDTAEEVTATAGVFTFDGSTTAKCQTYYVKMHLTAGTYMMTYTQTAFTKVGSDGGQYYSRANIINNSGSAVISSAVSSGSTGSFTITTEGDYFFVYNAGGKVPGSTYTYQGYGTFNGKVTALENCDENTSLTYTVGAEAMTIVKTPSTSISRVVKVDLAVGDYTLSVSATEWASTYIYGSMSAGKGSNQVASLTVYQSISFAGTKDFTITTAGTYYFASAYGVTFSIVSK